MSRRFSEVGVGIDAGRLREIAAGAPAADSELTDVEFAVIASGLKHNEHVAPLVRAKRLGVKCLVVTGMGLVMFGALLFMAWLLLSLMLQTSPL